MINEELLKEITKKQTKHNGQTLGRASITIYDLNLKRRIDKLADETSSNYSSIVHNSLSKHYELLQSPQTNLDNFGPDYPPPSIRDHNDKWIKYIKRLKTADDIDHINVKLRQITTILNDRLNEIKQRERAIYESKRIGLSAEEINKIIKEVDGEKV